MAEKAKPPSVKAMTVGHRDKRETSPLGSSAFWVRSGRVGGKEAEIKS